jgi:hypothetical protein
VKTLIVREIFRWLRNIIAIINTIMWLEVIKIYDDSEAKIDHYIVEESTIFSLFLQIIILFLTPIAIVVKIILIFCIVLYRIGSIKL